MSVPQGWLLGKVVAHSSDKLCRGFRVSSRNTDTSWNPYHRHKPYTSYNHTHTHVSQTSHKISILYRRWHTQASGTLQSPQKVTAMLQCNGAPDGAPERHVHLWWCLGAWASSSWLLTIFLSFFKGFMANFLVFMFLVWPSMQGPHCDVADLSECCTGLAWASLWRSLSLSTGGTQSKSNLCCIVKGLMCWYTFLPSTFSGWLLGNS